VPHRAAYGSPLPYDHDDLFYGYDESRELFHLAGYSPDGKYVVGTIPFTALEAAYRTCPAEKFKSTVSSSDCSAALLGKIQQLADHERPVIPQLLQSLVVDEPAAAPAG